MTRLDVSAPRATTEEHVGEWKVSLTAATLEEIFAETARVIARAAGEARSDPGDWERIELAARDPATLLVDWANELLGRSEVAGLAYHDVRDLHLRELPDGSVEITAEVRGRHVPVWTSPVKAATYHDLRLEPTSRGWRAVVLFDV